MKTTFITIVLYFFTLFSFSQTKILSWNLENFGKSKTDSEINFIASTVVDYDIVAIQEVVAGYGGAQAIAKLAAILNEKGTKWDYTISEPTSDSSYKAERYAFIWKTSKAKLKGKPSLEKNLVWKLIVNLIMPHLKLAKRLLL
ncbi:hypothetical protein ACQ9BO_23995 [Flavobacterium sp. P21]|uniref:hypothetical protein n=1 Tax=Flavobacterium sp. P21 TaxID=3423948 RepID=UPI003D67BFDA